MEDIKISWVDAIYLYFNEDTDEQRRKCWALLKKAKMFRNSMYLLELPALERLAAKARKVIEQREAEDRAKKEAKAAREAARAAKKAEREGREAA